MKKQILCIFLLSAFFALCAQDITISFQPAVSGIKIDSVLVTNQKTGNIIKLLGNESLVLTKPTGVNILPTLNENGFIFPNPCNGDAELIFPSFIDQDIEVRIINISGQVLGFMRQKLFPGQHTFTLKFPVMGLYAVSILQNSIPLSFKVVCCGVKIQDCEINYTGSDGRMQLKNAVTERTMNYTQGDILLFSAFSGKNSTIITDSPKATKIYSVVFYECVDPDKQSYPIVKIGMQVWMAKNLSYLPAVSPPTVGSYTEKYYYVYGYSGTNVVEAKATVNYAIYGVLYNWTATMNGAVSSYSNPSGVRGACPIGWHIPSDSEWTTLTEYLKNNGYGYEGKVDDAYLAKSLASQTNWTYFSAPGTPGNDPYHNNNSGFSGPPGGNRDFNRTFNESGSFGFWWSSKESSPINVIIRALRISDSSFCPGCDYPKEFGLSVRCVKD